MKKIIFILFILYFLFGGICMAASVKLEWDANTEGDLAGYKVYYGGESGSYSDTVDVGNVTFFTVTSLSEGLFFFAVTAYDTSGNESDFSNEVSADIDLTPPSIPTNLRTTGVTKTFVISVEEKE